MKLAQLRSRFWFEIALGVVAGGLTLLTVLVPDWIEVAFRIDPDESSGILETGITFVALLAMLIAVFSARLEWRQTRGIAAGPGGVSR